MHFAGGAGESRAVSYLRFPASRGRKRLGFAGGAGESWPFPLGKTHFAPHWLYIFEGGGGLAGGLAGESVAAPPNENRTLKNPPEERPL